jgi:flagellar hook-associated protein 2
MAGRTGSLALSGLSSGVDTSGVVQQLLASDRARVSRMEWRQQAVHAQQTQLRGVASKLSGLLAAVKALGSDPAYARKQDVVSSDPSKVAVSALGGAGAGGRSISVDRLASAAQRSYAYTPGAGTLELAPSANPQAVTRLVFNAAAKLEDVVARINAAQDAPVYAAAMDGRLVLSARATGAQSDFVVGGSLADGLQEDARAARVGAQLNAVYRLDGDDTPRTAQSNVVDHVVPGLRFTFKAVTSAPVSVTASLPSVDEAALTAKVKAVATAFNSLVDAVKTATSEKPVADPRSASQAAKGTLFGDTGLQALVRSVRRTMLDTPGAGLPALGISIPKAGAATDDATAGRLNTDDAAIAKTLQDDPAMVKRTFAAITKQLEPLVKSHTGGSGAVLDVRVASGDRQVRDITAQMTQANRRIDAQEQRLRGQFAGMEKALGVSQSQQIWLAGMLSRTRSRA